MLVRIRFFRIKVDIKLYEPAYFLDYEHGFCRNLNLFLLSNSNSFLGLTNQ